MIFLLSLVTLYHHPGFFGRLTLQDPRDYLTVHKAFVPAEHKSSSFQLVILVPSPAILFSTQHPSKTNVHNTLMPDTLYTPYMGKSHKAEHGHAWASSLQTFQDYCHFGNYNKNSFIQQGKLNQIYRRLSCRVCYLGTKSKLGLMQKTESCMHCVHKVHKENPALKTKNQIQDGYKHECKTMRTRKRKGHEHFSEAKYRGNCPGSFCFDEIPPRCRRRLQS